MNLRPFARVLRPLVPPAMRRRLRRWSANDRTRAELFGRIYRDNLWGGRGDDFYSGTGSHTPELIDPYVGAVRAFLAARPSRPVVIDLGCGDFVAGGRLADLARSSVGCDVVPELIERNRRLFARDGLEFAVLDAVVDPLPPGDVVVAKQVLQHLSNAEIATIVAKLAQYPTWIVCEHLPEGAFTTNLDKPTDGGCRLRLRSGVVLTEPPFGVTPRETRLLCEARSEGGIIRTVAYAF
jgi:Methyltransferase domain